MEKRVTYYASRKNLLTWLVTLLLACSVAVRIADFCGEKGAEAVTVWMGLILPVAACLLFGLILLLDGKEHLYRTAMAFAVMCVYMAWSVASGMEHGWFKILAWVALLVVANVFNMTVTGRIRSAWLMGLVLLAILGTECFLGVRAYGVSVLRWDYTLLADCAMSLAVLLTLAAMQPHLDEKYHPTWGDRADGRRIRTLPPISMVGPYIMPNRTGASNLILNALEISAVEKYIHQKRKEGLTGFGITHVFIAAYVRCVAKFPALNRFLAGQRVYTHDRDIQFSMTIKKDMTVEAPDTCIKLHFDPADTAYDIYKKFNEAVTEVKNTPLNSDMDQVAKLLTFIPGLLLKFVVWLLKVLDYFGLLPGFLLEVSPFHGSVFFTSMGSLGIPSIVHHLYDFGNLPVFCAFGKKYRKYELNANGEVELHKYVDYGFNLDERTVDGFYYAAVLKEFNRIMRDPSRLDTPPEEVLRDID